MGLQVYPRIQPALGSAAPGMQLLFCFNPFGAGFILTMLPWVSPGDRELEKRPRQSGCTRRLLLGLVLRQPRSSGQARGGKRCLRTCVYVCVWGVVLCCP